MYRIDAIKLESEKIALRAQMMRPAAKVQQEKPPAHKKKTLNLRKRKQSDSPSQVKPPRGKKMKFTNEVAAKQQEEVKDD